MEQPTETTEDILSHPNYWNDEFIYTSFDAIENDAKEIQSKLEQVSFSYDQFKELNERIFKRFMHLANKFEFYD